MDLPVDVIPSAEECCVENDGAIGDSGLTDIKALTDIKVECSDNVAEVNHEDEHDDTLDKVMYGDVPTSSELVIEPYSDQTSHLQVVGVPHDKDVLEDSEDTTDHVSGQMSPPDGSHILSTEEPTILTDVQAALRVSTSLASALHAAGDQEVIKLLLPNEDDAGSLSGQQQINISVPVSSMTQPPREPPQTVQAITLANGSTAFIKHPDKDGKFLEGQTITLEDGTTAVVQGLTTKVPQVSLVPSSQAGVNGGGDGKTVLAENQSVQLEDGTTAFIPHGTTNKDNLQAIILEDGTTAYLATQQATVAPFAEAVAAGALDGTSLNLEHLTSQITGVHALMTNGTAGLHDIQVKQINTSNAAVNTSIIVGQSPDKNIPPGEKAYKCNFEGCGRLYTTLHHLKVHERSHTGDRPFKCDFTGCGKAFATGYGLKSHTRVHTGEKPYKCPEEPCDKAFKTSGDLQKHIRTHTGERPFKCPFEGCDRSFTTSNIRKVHIRTHTGERPYCCPEEGCGRAFASATNYKNHIRIHTGEKPYVCTVQGCGKRFTEYSSLYKHHVVHTHSKPYVCNHCGKTYRQTSTLAMHKRTAHGEDVTAETEAALFDQHDPDLEPPDKKQRINFTLTPEGTIGVPDGEGPLVINTSDAGQHIALLGTDGLSVIPGGGDNSSLDSSPTQSLLQQFQQQAGVATFTLGDQGQQVYVITDPSQLEALQQLAQQQLEADSLDASIITSLPSSTEDGSLASTEDVMSEHSVTETTIPNVISIKTNQDEADPEVTFSAD